MLYPKIQMRQLKSLWRTLTLMFTQKSLISYEPRKNVEKMSRRPTGIADIADRSGRQNCSGICIYATSSQFCPSSRTPPEARTRGLSRPHPKLKTEASVGFTTGERKHEKKISLPN
jgi:hypothetical protein